MRSNGEGIGYDIDKLKFSLDESTWQRAVALYEAGKVKGFAEDPFGFSAVVDGGHRYRVSVSRRQFDRCSCDCYLGEHDELCKHAVAVAIFAVLGGRKLGTEERERHAGIRFCGKTGDIGTDELAEMKRSVSSALRLIRPYEGPSRIWFSYQNALDEGCARIDAILSELPAGRRSAKYLISLLLRMDKKLCEGGVDDSNGTVGNCMERIVGLLESFAEADPECIREFAPLAGRSTCFDWEEPLVAIIDSHAEE
ncbi:MAG: hypothetical protein HGA33_03425 [Candidatus Moranbacteria bacterium]|nr:hypothetical protein [Candidatus Moranbacteria bacterium]